MAITWQELAAHISPQDLANNPNDTFEVVWAKVRVKHHKEFLARAELAQLPEISRRFVEERYAEACAILLAKILRES